MGGLKWQFPVWLPWNTRKGWETLPKGYAILDSHLKNYFTRQFWKPLPQIQGPELVLKQTSIHKHSWAQFCRSFKIPFFTSEIPSSLTLLLLRSQVLSLDHYSCLPRVLWESKGPQLPQEVFKAKNRAQQVTEHCQEGIFTSQHPEQRLRSCSAFSHP